MNDLAEQQKARSSEDEEAGSERLIMLSDGVFAIAMTLLVLDIKIPANMEFSAGLEVLATKTFYYLITFVVIAGYWSFHRRLMHSIRRVDTRFIQFSLLFLASVAFFPVAMNLMAEFGRHPGAVIIYTLVLAICGLLGQGLRFYAFWKQRLVDSEIDRGTFIYRTALGLLFPVYSCLTLLLLLIPGFQQVPANIFFFWLLTPILVWVIRLLYKSRLVGQAQSLQGQTPAE